jgi:pantetheine-phosphate adenylyltransferase
VKLLDPYGPALSEKYDFLIVSPETYQGGEEINERRFETGLPPLKIIKVDYVRSKDGKVISSTRIKRGEIDKNGNPL